MRLVFTPPAGCRFVSSVISYEGHFYVLCYLSGVCVHIADLTDGRQQDFRAFTPAWNVQFHVVPDRGLCVSVAENEAVVLATGERLRLNDDPNPGRYHSVWHLYQAWLAKRNQYTVGGHDQRSVGTDTHVFMTGSGARTSGEIAMGPTQYKKVMAVRGLSKGCVVSYRRGGEARVLRLTDRTHNPIHLIAAEDGLTFLAVCRAAVYQIDADVE